MHKEEDCTVMLPPPPPISTPIKFKNELMLASHHLAHDAQALPPELSSKALANLGKNKVLADKTPILKFLMNQKRRQGSKREGSRQ